MTIDTEARDRIAKMWTELRELSADYWGVNRDNGKRSVLASVVERVDAAEVKIKHYEDTRESSCLGLAALAAYESTAEGEAIEMKVAGANNRALMRVQWIQVAGLVIVALIALLR